ncbi:MAG: substrate-binding domain-containing protein [bacterium]|nr:substrate-binding domain-containing protein [bacterium]
MSSPTLEDVARRAGVSTATVSRCLNTPDSVVPNTRDKVLRVVAELGYTPHFGGRALASNRSNTIGAVIPTMDNAIFATGLQAVQETLAEANVTLLVASSCYDPERELEQIRALVGRGADGLILIGIARTQKTYDFLHRRQITYVIAWNYRSDEKHCFAGFDNVEAAERITKQVIDYGHRNIAMIAGVTEYNDRATDRVIGVRNALNLAGLAGDQMQVVEASYSLKKGEEALDKILQRSPQPTAIICGNDVLAVGAINKAKQLGMRIPEDVSITGFDDIELAAVVEPRLTTVHVPHKRMGKAAARLLLAMRDDRKNCHSIKLETHTVLRDSLGTILK